MQSVVILSARFNAEQGRLEVAKELTLDDGTVEYNCHSFSIEAAEWNAALYDIETLDEAVDSVLYEPFVGPVDLKRLQHSEERASHLQRIRDAKVSLTPRSGNGVKAQDNNARKARMRSAGIPDEFVDAVDTDPYEVIRAACVFDSEARRAKRQHFDAMMVKMSNVKVAPVDRIGRLRPRATQKRPDKEEKKRGVLPPIILGKGD